MGFLSNSFGSLGHLSDTGGRLSNANRMNAAYDAGISKAEGKAIAGVVVGLPALAYQSFIQARDEVQAKHGDENPILKAAAMAASTPVNFVSTLFRAPGKIIVDTPRDLRAARSFEDVGDAFFARAGVAASVYFAASGAISLFSAVKNSLKFELGFKPMGHGLAYATNSPSVAIPVTAVAKNLGGAMAMAGGPSTDSGTPTAQELQMQCANKIVDKLRLNISPAQLLKKLGSAKMKPLGDAKITIVEVATDGNSLRVSVETDSAPIFFNVKVETMKRGRSADALVDFRGVSIKVTSESGPAMPANHRNMSGGGILRAGDERIVPGADYTTVPSPNGLDRHYNQ